MGKRSKAKKVAEEVVEDVEEEEEEEEEVEEEKQEEEEAKIELEKGDKIELKVKRKWVEGKVIKRVDGSEFKLKYNNKVKTVDLSDMTWRKVEMNEVEEIKDHKRKGSEMFLKVAYEGNDKTAWVSMDSLNCTDLIEEYQEAEKKEREERNKEREERRNEKKPAEVETRRGRAVKKINYSVKAMRDAYEPVESDSEDEFENATKAQKKQERRQEARAAEIEAKEKKKEASSRKRKRSSMSGGKKSNRKRKKVEA